jgi:hypothetical protein
MTTTEPHEVPLTVPLRPCTPWCDTRDRDGHPDQHPEDRACWSAFEKVPLTLRSPVKMCDGEWWHDYLEAVLCRRPATAEPVVILNYEGEPAWEFALTPREARLMRDALNRLIEVASTT